MSARRVLLLLAVVATLGVLALVLRRARRAAPGDNVEARRAALHEALQRTPPAAAPEPAPRRVEGEWFVMIDPAAEPLVLPRRPRLTGPRIGALAAIALVAVTAGMLRASDGTYAQWTSEGTATGTLQAASDFDGTPTPTPDEFTLTVTRTGSGSGTVTSNPAGINCGSDCAEDFDADTSVTLTATPAAGSFFDRWSGCSTSTSASITVSMTQDRTCTARFELIEDEPTPTPTPEPDVVLEPGDVQVEIENEVEAEVSATEPTSVTTQNGSGSLTVTAPAGALPAGTRLSVASIANLAQVAQQARPPSGASLVLGFVAQVRDADGQPFLGDFAEPVTLEFTLNAGVLPAGTPEGDVVVAFWDGFEWVEVDAVVTLQEDGSYAITASVTHFTIFGVFHQPGRGTLSPPPAYRGVNLALWRGGTLEELIAAVPADARSLWVTREGRFVGYTLGAPPFVNRAFVELYPAGRVPSGTALLVVR